MKRFEIPELITEPFGLTDILTESFTEESVENVTEGGDFTTPEDEF